MDDKQKKLIIVWLISSFISLPIITGVLKLFSGGDIIPKDAVASFLLSCFIAAGIMSAIPIFIINNILINNILTKKRTIEKTIRKIYLIAPVILVLVFLNLILQNNYNPYDFYFIFITFLFISVIIPGMPIFIVYKILINKENIDSEQKNIIYNKRKKIIRVWAVLSIILFFVLLNSGSIVAYYIMPLVIFGIISWISSLVIYCTWKYKKIDF